MNAPVDAPAGGGDSGLGLRDVMAILIRRRLILAGAAAMVTVAAYLVSVQQPAVYESAADVLLGRQNLASGLTGTPDPNAESNAGDRVAQTQSRLATAPIVARRTLNKLKITDRDAEELLDNVAVTVEPDSDILSFKVRDEEVDLAPALVNEYARQAIIYQSQLDSAAVARAQRRIDARVDRLRKRGRTKGVLYSALVAKQQQLRTLGALQTSNSYLVRRATGAEKVQPMPARNALLGLIVGLVLGIGLAFAREAFDTRLRVAEDMAAAFQAPLLARIPTPRRTQPAMRLAVLEDPRGPASEAYGQLRGNVALATRGRNVKTVMVSGAAAREGRSTTIANLAVATARAGRSVALVDLDLRHPSLRDIFDLEGSQGVTDVVDGSIPLDQVCFEVELEIVSPAGAQVPALSREGADLGSLTVIPAGTIPLDPGEFVARDRLASLLAELRETRDQVFIDAPPMLRFGDAMTLAALVDAVLLVGRLGTLQAPAAREAHRLLTSVPAVVLGVAVTGVTARGAHRYAYAEGRPVTLVRNDNGFRPDEEIVRAALGVLSRSGS